MFFDWLLYRRTSTVEQGENNTSLETQDQECRKRAGELGYNNEPAYVVTEMESGAFMDRPALEEMLRIVREALVSLVVIFNSDRLARDPLHLLMIIRTFAEAGVRLEFVHGSSDNSPEGELLAFCTGWAAQRERAMIAERSRLGKEATARSGRVPLGFGPGIYGYDYDPLTKSLSVNEEETRVVRLIYQWVIEGVATNAIAVRLNDMSIPSKTGKMWSRTMIKEIASNTRYYGLMYFGKRRHRKVGPGKIQITERPIEEAIPVWGFVPETIDKSLFDRAQERLNNPVTRRGKKQGNQYLLTGFIRCPRCNSPVTGAMKARGTRYYRCTGAITRPERPSKCVSRYIHESMEQVIWDMEEEVVKDPEILSREIEQHVQTGDGNLEEEAGKLRRETAAIANEQRRLIRLYGKEEVDQDILESESAKLKLARQEKEQALRALEEQQRSAEAAIHAKEQIGDFCKRISERLGDLDFDGKRGVLAAMGVRGEVTEESISVTMVVDPGVTTVTPSSPSRHPYSYTVVLKPRPDQWLFPPLRRPPATTSEEQRERRVAGAATRRQEARNQGLCSRCQKEMPVEEGDTYQACADWDMWRRHRFVAQGICTACRKRVAKEGPSAGFALRSKARKKERIRKTPNFALAIGSARLSASAGTAKRK